MYPELSGYALTLRTVLFFSLFSICLHAQESPIVPPLPVYYGDYQLAPSPAKPIVEYNHVMEKPAASAPESVITTTVPQVTAFQEKKPEADVQSKAAEIPAPVPARKAEPSRNTPAPVIVSTTERVPAVTIERLQALPVEVYARTGERFSLMMEGSPWLFTDIFPDDADVDYAGRSRENSGDRLTFIAGKTGRLILSFVKGTSNGEQTEVRKIVVEVLSEEDFQKAVGLSPETILDADSAVHIEKDFVTSSVISSDDEAWSAARSGQYDSALTYLQDRYSDKTALVYVLLLMNGESETAEVNEEYTYPSGYNEQKAFIESLLTIISGLSTSERITIMRHAADDFSGFNGIDRILFLLADLYQQPGGP